jgi:DNA-binding HxlR family transcriptional regulator
MADRSKSRSGAPAKPGDGHKARPKQPELTSVIGRLSDEGGAEVFRLVNERVRLGILSALAVAEHLSFAELKQTLGVTDGNLSIHARKLEEAGFVMCEKTFQDRRPLTQYALTPKGRAAFQRYLGHMEALIDAMRKST